MSLVKREGEPMVRVLRSAVVALLLTGLLACAPKGPQPKTLVLNGFERVPDPALLKRQFDPAEALKKPTYPNHDFDVATSGYASLEAYSKDHARAAGSKELYQFIQGKTAAKARFTVPSDYRTPGTDNFPRTWESGFGLSIDSRTPLVATDWTAYKYLSLRVFNPAPLAQELFIRFSDSASKVTTTSVSVPQGESEIEVPLGLLVEARLNPRDIKAVTFYLDSAGPFPVLRRAGLAGHGRGPARQAGRRRRRPGRGRRGVGRGGRGPGAAGPRAAPRRRGAPCGARPCGGRISAGQGAHHEAG
jgi:hypothetical protein